MNIKFSARDLASALFAILLIVVLDFGADARVAASTPVSSCGTLSPAGNYVLTKNLTASGDCLVIGAPNVAIDMNGKTITGDGTGSAITDDGIERDFPIISNGKIRNFETGIDLDNSGSGIISNVDSSVNSGDGVFIARCCNTLDAVSANANGGTGIVIDSDDSSLSNIQANANGDDGIDITECCNTLVGSTVSNNTDTGVLMEGCCSFVIASKIQKNSSTGVELTDEDDKGKVGHINSNTSHNGGDGMSLAEDSMVTASKSNGNGGSGINYDGTKFGVISGVKANNNSANGVNMNCRGSTASLTAKNNGSDNLVQTVSDGPCANVNLKAP